MGFHSFLLLFSHCSACIRVARRRHHGMIYSSSVLHNSSFVVVSQEMVGAAGPLRKGDEVEYLVPEGRAVEAGRRAVGAIRVQVRAPP